jgi:hypothetical protein
MILDYTTSWLRGSRALLAAICCLLTTSLPGAEPGLAVLMERMQTYTHKLQLSIDARNAPLADFYLHELEETTEFVVGNIERYREFPVAELVKEMLLPMIEQLEEVLEEREWAASEARFTDLIRACNGCHQFTGRGFIHIAPAVGNPFAQDFSVTGD